MNPSIKDRFSTYPDHIKPIMESLRDLIYEVANATDEVGDLGETLKWVEPAYLTKNTKSGSTLERLRRHRRASSVLYQEIIIRRISKR